MKTIGIVDADLIGRDKHRFPNLAAEKISAYYKDIGYSVKLLTDYNWSQDDFSEIFVCKCFTDTPVPDWVKETNKIHIGGTGFFFDKAPNLPDKIEHHMPDYHLYDEWISIMAEKEKQRLKNLGKAFNESAFKRQFSEYTDCSIGFLTRGCFRKCGFCVNKKYSHIFPHSPLEEFLDKSRKSICLLDDNFFGYPKWRPLMEQLIASNKRFKFKQGLDERLLNSEKCSLLFTTKYDGDIIFAFDKIEDYDLVKSKLELIRSYETSYNYRFKFYVLVGFESTDENDIENAFKRIDLLMQYKCTPYIMRFQNKNETPWKESVFRDAYIQIASWCNQPQIFNKMSFREYCEGRQKSMKTEKLCAAKRVLHQFEEHFPNIADKYFDLKFSTRGSFLKP